MPTGAAADTIVCPYNDVDAAAAAVARYGEGLAAVIVEPVAGNMGVVPPEPGFLEALRALCDASGALLVFDEVITGFRVARGGAQERYGVSPDLTVLGKIVGGGLPLAAFGGRADVMERLAPAGDVYQAGTLSGNPLATAAGLSVLRRLRDPAVYERARADGRRARGRARAVRARAARRRDAHALHAPTGRCATSTTRRPRDTERYGELFRHLLERGIYVAPSQFEACSSRLAHGDEEIDRTVEAVGDLFGVDVWEAIAAEAAAESPLWGEALRPGRSASSSRSSRRSARSASRSGSRRSTRATSLHYGRPRLFAPPTATRALLLGDYLYAHGLVRIAAHGRGRRGRRPRRADLALRAAPRGRRPRATARPGRRPRRCSAAGRWRRRATRRARGVARAAAGDEAVDRALSLHGAASVRLGRRCSPLLADAAKEGRDVIIGMLIVGLIFLAVIGLGTPLPQAQEALSASPTARASARLDGARAVAELPLRLRRREVRGRPGEDRLVAVDEAEERRRARIAAYGTRRRGRGPAGELGDRGEHLRERGRSTPPSR